MNDIERGAEILGYVGVVASWQRYTPTAKTRYQPYVLLQSCGGMGDAGFEPAQSITITGKAALIALKKVVDEALKYEEVV